MKNIVLIGIMGSGKTSIAKILGEKLNREVIDLDEYLEAKFQMTIPEMFEISEKYFRDNETLVCKDLQDKQDCIISTGGGVIGRPENMAALSNNATIVYINRPLELIMEDIEVSSRPLLKDGADKLKQLFKQRHPIYLSYCDVEVINDSSLDDIVNKIIKETKTHS